MLIEILSHALVMVHAIIGNLHQKQIQSYTVFGRLYLFNKIYMFVSCVSFEYFVGAILYDNPLVALVSFPGFLFRLIAMMDRMLVSGVKLMLN